MKEPPPLEIFLVKQTRFETRIVELAHFFQPSAQLHICLSPWFLVGLGHHIVRIEQSANLHDFHFKEVHISSVAVGSPFDCLYHVVDAFWQCAGDRGIIVARNHVPPGFNMLEPALKGRKSFMQGCFLQTHSTSTGGSLYNNSMELGAGRTRPSEQTSVAISSNFASKISWRALVIDILATNCSKISQQIWDRFGSLSNLLMRLGF